MHKILKIVAAVLSLLGIVFLIRIISKGDEAIKAAALEGDTAIVDPMAIVTYIVLGLVLLFVVVFVLKNLFTNTGSLKNTLIGVGLFAAVLIIAYAVSGGDTNTYMYNNKVATEGQSHMVGAGLIAFYILIIGAAAAMLFAGAKKMIK
ncbi:MULTISPECIES: hypothetical protein [Flavobacteriaceae]|jgi:multisubunit Na+/H+ antiporter MnhB subunit|uniref:Uncharacterized protein n=2 Tax=Flavobacteriaceae TaxID=49546 RepID=A0ABP3ULV0_9FLAO|nr:MULTISPECIES: hypothetical protein [Flavobacteriaceae]RYH73485.1 hypothetical protein EVU94_09850 [Flavobacteriaceae bacterium 144Ye]TBV25203.1 hypothetical protein DMZ43_12900 [Meridianimaribacter sp. CL38]TDY10619.1 hypothetical protein A8975_2347 [Meridianimaribacter flavus]